VPVVQFSPHELQGSRIFLLVEIDFGTFGRFRISTEPLHVPGDGGGQFLGGLDSLTFTDSVDLFSTTESNRSVSVSALLPVDVSELVARGFDPARATASLSQWVQGSNYADRRRVLSAVELRDPQYGESYEPFRFSMRSNMHTSDSMIPPADAVIDATTFPSSLNWQRGYAYPWVFGVPGKIKSSVSGLPVYNYTVPAYPVVIDESTQGFVIAGHEMTPGTVVNIVEKESPGSVHTATVYTHRDGAGRLVSIAPYGSPSTFGPMTDTGITGDPGVEGIEFVASIPAGGGVLNDQQTAPRRGMGEIIEYLLDYAPQMKIDRGRTRTAGDLINSYKMDAVITEPVEVWRWLRANLLPFAPVSITQGADGMYPIVWQKDMTANDTVANVDAERNQWERTSPITVEFLDSEPRNNFAIAYNKSGLSDRMVSRATLDGSKSSSNSYARTSFARYGRRDKAEQDAIGFYQSADVDAVLSWWSRIYGFPIKTTEYTAPIEWGWLEAGSYIVFSDYRLRITDQIAVVQAVEFTEDQIVGLRLVWLEDLPRDSRFL